MVSHANSAPATAVIVFTDLDGSLLDHDSYRHDAADSALQRLAAFNIPCVPVTSKTRAEVLAIRAELGLATAFIVENGGAAFIPDACPGFDCSGLPPPDNDGLHVQRFGREHADILVLLKEISAGGGYHWRGLSDMSVEELAQYTGLSASAAQKASRREYCEPVVWLDDETQLQPFMAALQAHGLRAVHGGRFLHIMDAAADKGRAVQWLAQRYAGSGALSIALGDSANDADMLNCVDIAVLVRSEHHGFPQAQGRRQTLHSEATGPAGWAEAMHRILDELEEKRGQLNHG